MAWNVSPKGSAVAVLVCSLAIVGYAYRQAHQQEQVACQCRGAVDAATAALIGVRDGDSRVLKSVIYERSADWFLVTKSRNSGKALAHVSEACGLESMSDQQIRESLRIVPNVPERLVVSILCWSIDRKSLSHLESPLAYIVVKCKLPKHTLVLVCLKQQGKWKSSGLPSLSARVLGYKTVSDACRHNDAVVD